MKSKLVIGFLTCTNPLDKNSWSGTHYRMFKALEDQFEQVIPLGPIPTNRIINGIIRRIDHLSQKVFKKKYNREHNFLKSWYYSRYTSRKIKNQKIDILFAAASSGALVFLKTKTPICICDDATFNQLLEYYPNYSNILNFSIKESTFLFKKVIKKTKFLIYPSEWAANDAVIQFGLKKQDVHVVGFGANINYLPNKNIIKTRDYSSKINILFLGRDWERKGGEIVLETFNVLAKKGYDIELTVCGCVPPVTHPKMKVIPFLNKNIKNEKKEFNDLLYKSHILFVPTRAECYGIVFCEAAAFGIPVITTDTGGVSSIVKNSINGYALPYDSKPQDYANQIQSLLDDPQQIERMALAALDKFENILNWNVWGTKIKEIFLSQK
ncbi:MAG: glycosyltransferase involved in cell wall biosynthesis [Polaribacter sp.]|jgi:glycosyltransferase involved in cell wall biosynthesis